MDELTNRAFRAYFQTAKRGEYSAAQPSNSSGQYEVGDMSYIVLRNGNGILAVYRVRNDNILKRLKRWPAELGTAADGRCSDDWRYASLRRARARASASA